jgi:hypothetical protein
MNKPYLYILGGLAIVISVLAVATLSYAGGSSIRVPLVSSGLEKLMANLVAPGPQNVALPSNDIDFLVNYPGEDTLEETPTTTSIVMPTEWKSFNFNGYEFMIPSDWEAVWPSVETFYTTMLFQDITGTTVATLQSPAPTTGYPGRIISEQEKIINGNDYNFRILKVHGDPDTVESNLDFIVIGKLGYESEFDSPVFDPGYGIQVTSRYTEDASEIFDEIYKSIKIGDEWLTYTSDVFTFAYPKDWRVVSDAGAGHRNAKFFDESNKLVASFVCPIPETGYEGFDMTESHRTLQRSNMRYALDYWHGDDIDYGRNDLELILMETMTPKKGLEGGIFGTACQLISDQPNLTTEFERIHQSVTVR